MKIKRIEITNNKLEKQKFKDRIYHLYEYMV